MAVASQIPPEVYLYYTEGTSWVQADNKRKVNENILGSVQGRDWMAFGQPDLVECAHALGRGVGTRCFLVVHSNPNHSTILWKYLIQVNLACSKLSSKILG